MGSSMTVVLCLLVVSLFSGFGFGWWWALLVFVFFFAWPVGDAILQCTVVRGSHHQKFHLGKAVFDSAWVVALWICVLMFLIAAWECWDYCRSSSDESFLAFTETLFLIVLPVGLI